MKRTAGAEVSNDAAVTSHDDATMTSLEPFQQQQQLAVDVGNNVDEVMAGISDNENDIHGTQLQKL